MDGMTAYLNLVGNLGLGGAALWLMYKLAGNHISHNTEAIGELKAAIVELTAWLKATRR